MAESQPKHDMVNNETIGLIRAYIQDDLPSMLARLAVALHHNAACSYLIVLFAPDGTLITMADAVHGRRVLERSDIARRILTEMAPHPENASHQAWIPTVFGPQRPATLDNIWTNCMDFTSWEAYRANEVPQMLGALAAVLRLNLACSYFIVDVSSSRVLTCSGDQVNGKRFMAWNKFAEAVLAEMMPTVESVSKRRVETVEMRSDYTKVIATFSDAALVERVNLLETRVQVEVVNSELITKFATTINAPTHEAYLKMQVDLPALHKRHKETTVRA
jgi:hypothetical protein